jgi:hypothetical protein
VENFRFDCLYLRMHVVVSGTYVLRNGVIWTYVSGGSVPKQHKFIRLSRSLPPAGYSGTLLRSGNSPDT